LIRTPTPTQKLCRSCGQTKPASSFYRTNRRSGLQSKCKTCQDEYARLYRATRTDEERERQRAWARAYNKRKGIEARRIQRLKYAYSITPEDYDRLLNLSQGRCHNPACKGKARSGKRLGVDHCHQELGIRGLLCDPCNRGIGMLGDDLRGVVGTAVYLARFELGGDNPDDWMPEIERLIKEIHAGAPV
jgi:hypothetical protein